MFNDMISRALSVRITDLLMIVINDSNSFTSLTYKADYTTALFYYFRI